jgi:aminopeptidase N
MITPVRRLLPLFKPATYTITLDITKRRERVFSGEVVITGELPSLAKEIILHSKGLVITAVRVDDTEVSHTLVAEDDELIITTKNEFQTGNHTIYLAFKGTITDPMHGLYPSTFTLNGEDKELLMTQLESHHAREVFPCIDEPAAKAVFNLALITEPGVTTLANTPIKTQQQTGSTLKTSFEPTPNMSSYLLAFVVGELAYREVTNKHGVSIRAYATPDKVQHTDFALQIAADVLDYFDDYFDIPYPLPKCDMVAVPDFSAGAMENWGLVTYRESCMLVDDKNTPADTKEWVASVVVHELSHQWFGNLVTMKWWDDLWLNESFAKWMEHYAVEHLHPEWQVWEQFSGSEQQMALSRDSLANVQAVQQPVNHPDELHTLFDPAIVYAKGSCLIHMLHEYLGADVFRDGLRLYMQRHQYGNTEAEDLWAALSEVSGKNVRQFMNPWLHQPGHPVLTVGVANNTVTLHQRRFYANHLHAKKHDPTHWPLPLISDQIDKETLAQTSQTIKKQAGLLLINKGYTGFYHTQYDTKQQALLAKAIDKGELLPVDRLGLLADTVALTKAGLVSTVDLLALTAHYKNETIYPVWQTIGSVIGILRMFIRDDQQLKPHLQRYVRNLTQHEYNRLGWERIANEPYFDKLLRPSMISYMAYGEEPQTIQRALDLYDKAKKPEDIPPDVRSIVYAVAIRQRGEAVYKQLLNWYKATTSAEERINLLAGITATRDEKIAHDITTHFTTKLIKPQDIFYWFIYLIRNPKGTQAAWSWMTQNWPWISAQFKGGHDYSDFPKYAASGLSTRDQLQAYRDFFTPKLKEADVARVIEQSFEDIEVRVLWRERDFKAVADFLQKTP